ncbi:unnamed protein product [Euphydryas editha]|uniref:Uncharacterized protein n=1 Tax=Euphydryas editha TaxID=104508 RepID=A0AAU9TES9_EUPED|nr:unnamed protein product [Euphydryas editha]
MTRIKALLLSTSHEWDPTHQLAILLVCLNSLTLFTEARSLVFSSGGEIKSAGCNRVVVEFENASSANNFIDSPLFLKLNYKIISPAFHITRMGIVKQIPIDWSMEEFLSSIKCSTPSCRAIKARRLNRKSVTDGKTEWLPTVVVTFINKTSGP